MTFSAGFLRASTLQDPVSRQEKQARKPHFYPAPKELADLIAVHIEKIFEAGYAQSFSVDPDAGGDFYHGHLIWRTDSDVASVFRVGAGNKSDISQIAMILYHTAEETDRWQKVEAHLPIEKRTPRSIVGYLDGSIRPAIDIVGDPYSLQGAWSPNSYVPHGTVHPFNIVDHNPGLYAGPSYDRVGYSFNFKPHPDGPNMANGERIVIYFTEPAMPVPEEVRNGK